MSWFYSSRWPRQIGPTAENDRAAIPPPIFFMSGLHFFISKKSQRKSVLLQKNKLEIIKVLIWGKPYHFTQNI